MSLLESVLPGRYCRCARPGHVGIEVRVLFSHPIFDETWWVTV
jgi:hypothetical protein